MAAGMFDDRQLRRGGPINKPLRAMTQEEFETQILRYVDDERDRKVLQARRLGRGPDIAPPAPTIDPAAGTARTPIWRLRDVLREAGLSLDAQVRACDLYLAEQSEIARLRARELVSPTHREAFPRLLKPSELHGVGHTESLIGDILYRGQLAQIAGPPGSFKSFVALGLAAAVALGRDWDLHRVAEGGRVIYVVAEGIEGVEVRLRAWAANNGVAFAELEDRLLLTDGAVQLGDAEHVERLAALAAEHEAVLTVLDTRSRCTTGIPENDATAQGEAVAAADRIRRAAGCAVLGVHHTGKDPAAGGRGSNVWNGAVWSDLLMYRDDAASAHLHVQKHKDAADGFDRHFRLLDAEVPENEMPGVEERYRRTLVAVPSEVPIEPTAGDSHTTRARILAALGDLPSGESLTAQGLVDATGASKSAVYRLLKELEQDRAIWSGRGVGGQRYSLHQPTR